MMDIPTYEDWNLSEGYTPRNEFEAVSMAAKVASWEAVRDGYERLFADLAKHDPKFSFAAITRPTNMAAASDVWVWDVSYGARELSLQLSRSGGQVYVLPRGERRGYSVPKPATSVAELVRMLQSEDYAAYIGVGRGR